MPFCCHTKYYSALYFVDVLVLEIKKDKWISKGWGEYSNSNGNILSLKAQAGTVELYNQLNYI